MTVNQIMKQVDKFAEVYAPFKAFQCNVAYKEYWDLCYEGGIADKELLKNIIFCNDTLKIPPIKTFLTAKRDCFIKLTGNERASLDRFTKQSIGAFWGMVFKYGLGYSEQKSTSVSMNDYFNIKTATLYSGKNSKIIIE